VGEGPLEDADLVLETDEMLRPLLTGELSADEAIESGRFRVTGNRDLLTRFVEVFQLPSVASPTETSAPTTT
jgi:alkyl sulfatase BDS1-like metallo-beta-lactamase superfamily hydrolase